MTKFFLVLTVFIIFLATTEVANTQPLPVTAFYKLAVQWPSSYCSGAKAKCFNVTQGFFTVHGLWPHLKGGAAVPPYSTTNRCTATPPPTAAQIKSSGLASNALTDMMTYWPNLTAWTDMAANWKFWGHEWEKHGTCSSYADKQNYKGYFNKGLELMKQHNVLQYLDDQKIYPATTATKTAEEFSDAISKGLGGGGQNFTELICNTNAAKMLQLVEIRICFDANAVDVISCKKKKFQGCVASDKILFPPI